MHFCQTRKKFFASDFGQNGHYERVKGLFRRTSSLNNERNHYQVDSLGVKWYMIRKGNYSRLCI